MGYSSATFHLTQPLVYELAHCSVLPWISSITTIGLTPAHSRRYNSRVGLIAPLKRIPAVFN